VSRVAFWCVEEFPSLCICEVGCLDVYGNGCLGSVVV